MKNNQYIITYLFVFLIFTILVAELKAQQPDYGTWFNLEFKNDVSKKLASSLNFELRTFDTLVRVEEFIVESGVKFKAIKYFDIIGYYRYSRSYDSDWGFNNEHRLTGGTVFWIKPGRFKLSLQEKVQYGFKNIYKDGNNIIETRFLRSKLTINYNIPKSKINPFLSTEIYYDFSPYHDKEFDRVRYRLGIEYNLTKKMEVDVFLQYQQRINTNNNSRNLVIGFTVGYQLPAVENEEEIIDNQIYVNY